MRALALSLIALTGVATPRVAGQAPSSAPTSSPSRDAHARWHDLSEQERERLRKLYGEFQNLPKAEQDLLRSRANEALKEREKLDSKLSPMERDALQALGPDAKDQFLRGVLREQLARRNGGGKPLVTHEAMREILDLPLEQRREAMKQLLETAARASIERTLNEATKHNLIAPEERERIAGLPVRDAAKEVLGVRKLLVTSRLDTHPESRLSLSDDEWTELKELPAERFFERLDLLRALHGAIKTSNGPESAESAPGVSFRHMSHSEESVRARAKSFFLAHGVPVDEAEQLAAQRPLGKVLHSIVTIRGERATSPPSGRRGPAR